jgi:hypothetical protein
MFKSPQGGIKINIKYKVTECPKNNLNIIIFFGGGVALYINAYEKCILRLA